MAVSRALLEAKQYLYRHGVNTDTTVDPVDLLRDLVRENEKADQKRPPPFSQRKLKLR